MNERARGPGWWRHPAAWVVTLLFAVGALAPLLANDVPLAARVGGKWSFPAFAELVGRSVPGPGDLSWKQWAQRLQRYYSVVEALFSPDLIIVGGGVSKKADKFLPLLDLRAPITPAQLRNQAGIIGAAWHADHLG